jgi:Dolichyl-phosphate-mannose-protein mannosyltransferase
MRNRTAARLFWTVVLVYLIHFAPNVVRETYLAVALGESLSVRVDPYLGLHPDLFELEGRGAYINNNPGASMLGAIPYAIASPAIGVLFRLKPELARPKPPTTYDDDRPNRTRFMNEARARGLDVKLALAAATMHAGLMVPLAGLAALVVFWFLRGRLGDERKALWLALLYAFGTPLFFRSGYLSQNAILAHLVLFAYVMLARRPDGQTARVLFGAGALLGLGVVCDYSGVPLLVAFGAWVLLTHGFRQAVTFSAGAVATLLLLLGYQWIAFGNPFLPAQTYMPRTPLSVGWNGIQWPTADLLVRNLFDPRYGLFVFCPMLVAALAAPFLKDRPGGPTRRELGLILGASLALYLFNSAVQFAALQWNTGVRYMVPAVPLLFFALVPVLLKIPTWARYALIIPTLVISWAVAMVRESVPLSLGEVATQGPQLPWLITLRKTAQAYAPFLGEGVLANLVVAAGVLLVTGILVWLIWRRRLSPAAVPSSR